MSPPNDAPMMGGMNVIRDDPGRLGAAQTQQVGVTPFRRGAPPYGGPMQWADQHGGPDRVE
jgi:hypothetical protein